PMASATVPRSSMVWTTALWRISRSNSTARIIAALASAPPGCAPARPTGPWSVVAGRWSLVASCWLRVNGTNMLPYKVRQVVRTPSDQRPPTSDQRPHGRHQLRDPRWSGGQRAPARPGARRATDDAQPARARRAEAGYDVPGRRLWRRRLDLRDRPHG